jgi:uncharacterized protein
LKSVVSFPSDGESCAGWHLAGESDAFASDRGRPCVVMATGMGLTKDSGLLPFAEAFAEAGLDSLLFDYRGFGESGAEPRQLASPPRHRADLRAAAEFARGLDGVDPGRIVLWGWSWGASHAIRVAAEDQAAIVAVVAVTPEADGLATLRHLARQTGPVQMLRLTARGLRDLLGSVRGQPPELIPLVGPPGSPAALTTMESEAGYEALAGPSWRNEVPARVAIAEIANRSVRAAGRLRCPILIQATQSDTISAPDIARRLAWEAKGYAEMREYPGGHFDLLLGDRDRAIEHQLHFLRRHLVAGSDVAASTLKT